MRLFAPKQPILLAKKRKKTSFHLVDMCVCFSCRQNVHCFSVYYLHFLNGVSASIDLLRDVTSTYMLCHLFLSAIILSNLMCSLHTVDLQAQMLIGSIAVSKKTVHIHRKLIIQIKMQNKKKVEN